MARLSLCVVLAVLVGLAVPDAHAASWRPCGDGFGAECTRVTVPLDRSGALAGAIPLRVARLPGPAGGATLVYLSGGPGAGGLDELEGILWSISGITSSYRLVTFDQRGTG